MIRNIDGQIWFCCPECGKKLHPVAPGARGVFVKCPGRYPDGQRCNWAGEIRCPEQASDIQLQNIAERLRYGDASAGPPKGIIKE